MNLLNTLAPISLRTNFKSDKALVDKILILTSLSYINNIDLIEREIEHNKDIYIITNQDEELLAFFMINEEKVNEEDTYYLGLSACKDELKGQGLGKALYQKFMEDCRDRELKENRKFLLWWTTATPIVYYWFNKYVANVQPDMNGDYNADGAKIANQIKKEKFEGITADSHHPFILRSVAENTNYSITEQARLIVATESLKMDVFQKFNLKEENADRFLMIGYAPE